MATGFRATTTRAAACLLDLGAAGDLSDRQLLRRFADRDGHAAERAFATVVERHGPMVLRTCRAVLRDASAADDAFQATFLVLARHTTRGWTGSGDSVAGWLHQVARRTALCARATSLRRRKHEDHAATLAPVSTTDPTPDDLGAVLDAEIARLPDRFRAAVVLCLVEGHSHDQAARQLGWPVGTVQSRLARGRDRLRARLTRRGLAPQAMAPVAGTVPLALADRTAHLAVGFATRHGSVGLVPASVLSLFQEVRLMLFVAKWKWAGAAALVVGLGVSGVGVLAQTGPARPAGETTQHDEPTKPAAQSSADAVPDREEVEIHYRRIGPKGEVLAGRTIVGSWESGEGVDLSVEGLDDQGRVTNRRLQAEAMQFQIDLGPRNVRGTVDTIQVARPFVDPNLTVDPIKAVAPVTKSDQDLRMEIRTSGPTTVNDQGKTPRKVLRDPKPNRPIGVKPAASSTKAASESADVNQFVEQVDTAIQESLPAARATPAKAKDATTERLDALERKLDLILKHVDRSMGGQLGP